MITSKAILGFFVILIVVVLSIVLIRRNPDLMSRFINRGTQNDIELIGSPSPTPLVAGTTTTSSEGQTEGLIACTAELKSACAENDTPVCGSERIVTNGTETTRQLTYRSACSYCKLYGTDDVLDLGDEKYYPKGYTLGACTLTK